MEVLAFRVFCGRKVGQPHSFGLLSRDTRDLCHCISLSGRRKGEKHQRRDVEEEEKDWGEAEKSKMTGPGAAAPILPDCVKEGEEKLVLALTIRNR